MIASDMMRDDPGPQLAKKVSVYVDIEEDWKISPKNQFKNKQYMCIMYSKIIRWCSQGPD